MAGIVLLLATSLVYAFIMPQVKGYQSTVNAREILQQVAKTSSQLEAKLVGVEEAIKELGHQLHGDMVDLPEKQLEAFIIGRLQEISWRHEVELISVRPNKGKVVQIFRELLFDVEVTGDYFELFDWLRELDRELGFVVVKRYTIRPLENNSPSPRLSVRLTMVSYRKA